MNPARRIAVASSAPGFISDNLRIGSSIREIGIVTSGSPSPTLDKNIGLGYVPTALSTIGTKIAVEIRGKAIDAVVVKTPFYKRAK